MCATLRCLPEYFAIISSQSHCGTSILHGIGSNGIEVMIKSASFLCDHVVVETLKFPRLVHVVVLQSTGKELKWVERLSHDLEKVFAIWGLSAGTGKHCVFGHLGLVFIWSYFVFCLCSFCFTQFVLRYLQKLSQFVSWTNVWQDETKASLYSHQENYER